MADEHIEARTESAAPEEKPVEKTAEPAAKAEKASEKSGGPQQQKGGGERRANNREGGNREGGNREPRGDRGDRRTGGGGGPQKGGDRRPGGDRGDRRPDFAPEIEIEKLVADSLYLDNAAHAVVARMRDMDSGTKSQLRRLYNAVRRAVRTPENERQHQFVMLRARLAYTIARHSLRPLDPLERLLLQVTRKNDARGYERFRDLFEAIVAYNE